MAKGKYLEQTVPRPAPWHGQRCEREHYREVEGALCNGKARLSVPGSLTRSGAWTSKAKIGKTAREKRIDSHSRDLNASQELIGYVDQKNQFHLWVLI